MPTKHGQPQRTAWTRRLGEPMLAFSLVTACARSTSSLLTVDHPLLCDRGSVSAGRDSNSTWSTAQRIQRS